VAGRLWAQLEQLAGKQLTPNQWRQARQTIESHTNHNAYLYRTKISQRNGGPFGLVIKPNIYYPNGKPQYHFFHEPETITDICRFIEDQYQINLLPLYQAKTVPCIVTFLFRQPCDYCTAAALEFLREQYLKPDQMSSVSAAIDAKGIAIPPDDIIQIEDIDESDLMPR